MRDAPSNQSNQKPTYRDYQSFLQNYGTGARNDNLNISPASSGSSIQSLEADGPKTYNEFLRSYGTKKFGSVRMKNKVGADERDSADNKKLVRSELVIDIKPPEKVVVPKSADNSAVVPDEMIYAKTVVLKELLSKSPTLKKPPLNHFKTTNSKSIYHKLEQFTNDKKENIVSPPPLPNSKPPIVRRNSTNGSPKPPVPQKTFLKPDDFKRTNSQTREEQLIRDLQAMLNNPQPNTTTVIPVADPNADVDKNDPNVKKLVYNTYRGLLGAYNNKANNMVSTLPRNFVVQDRGVAKQVESITPQGVARQPSDRRAVEPPLVVQNAMLTKDKKPFTYTPGGIDLSEISSPRLARRVERNAMAPGVAEVQRTSPPRGYSGTLPPSALAAMQPALPVQVFPSGPPPPPPLPAAGHAPPPPPPMQPLPTKSFATNDGVFERPDMTKIIPENPMALLKKTPRVQRTIADDIGYGQPVNKPQMVQQRPVEPPQPPQPEIKTSTAQLGTLYIPPVVDNQSKNVQSPPVPPQRAPQSPTSPQSPIATLTRAPRPWQNQKPQQEVPAWAQKSQTPPETPQRTSPPIVQSRGPPTPATPTQPIPSPVTPTRAVPQPYQTSPTHPHPYQTAPPPVKGAQSPTIQGNVVGRVIIPVHMDGDQPNVTVDAVYVTQPVVLQHPGPKVDQNQQNLQQMRQQEQQRIAQQQQAQKEQQMRQQEQQRIAQQEQQMRQQQLLQQQQQQRISQQQQQQQSQQNAQKNVRIIPIQMEGTASNTNNNNNNNNNGNVQRRDSNKFGNASPVTPGSARVFNRQPSWSQGGPTQSNSFKVIQKITNTDGDDDEDEDPSEHPPRNSQQFHQVPVEQTRKLTLNDGDRELMNKVKQGVDEEIFLHREADPRYRGAAIPSKAFRLLQSMTDGSNRAPVPRAPQNAANNVRMIPVQIEGEPSGNYIPPSEQTVQEPKKYTGGKIPGRSFKMLQAMTGDPCATRLHQDPPFFGYPPYFPGPYFPPPYCPPPYWMPPYSPYPAAGPEFHSPRSRSARSTPVHFCEEADAFPSRCSSLPRGASRRPDDDRRRFFEDRYSFWDPYQVYRYPHGAYPYHVCNGCDYPDEEYDRLDSSEEEEETSVDAEDLSEKVGDDPNEDESEDSSDETEESSVKNEEIPHELSVIFEENINDSSETIAKGDQTEPSKEDRDWWNELKPTEEKEEVDFWKNILQPSTADQIPARKNQEVVIENHNESGRVTEENDEEVFEDKFEEQSENVTVNSDDHKYTLNSSRCTESMSVRPKNEEEVEENYVRSSKEQTENFEYRDDDFKCEINSEKSSDNTDFKIKEGQSLYHGNLSVSSRKKIFKEARECVPQTVKKEGISIEKEDSSSEVIKKTTVCTVSVDDGEEVEEVKIPSIKERIAALKIASEKRKFLKDDVKVTKKIDPEREEILMERIERNLLEDESSDSEEIDSGVTSDISRHISDTEEYSELSKMSKYQRAATHSRLFKLLQEECEIEDKNEAEDEKLKKNKENLQRRKESLTLALKNEEGFNSSGAESLTSPIVTDKLVKELVQSLLKRKKGEAFRLMPIEKLHNAAYRILREEMSESNDSTAVQTPQDFYDNYECSEDYDVIPSRTFKMIQEHSEQNRPGSITGFLAKCPRVLSSKKIPKRQSPESPGPEPVTIPSITEPNAS